MFASVCVRRTARPSWALLLSCAHAPTQNAVRMVRAVVQTGSVTWTAAVKTATALTLWTQHDKTGQSHGPLWWSWNKKKKFTWLLKHSGLFEIIHPFCASCYAAAWLAPRLHPSSLGRSSLRTTVRGRMLILLPAVLAPKMTPEQMASQTWAPPSPPGWWSGSLRTHQLSSDKDIPSG